MRVNTLQELGTANRGARITAIWPRGVDLAEGPNVHIGERISHSCTKIAAGASPVLG